MQIGSVKYTKDEEKSFFVAFLFGMFLGLPVGLSLHFQEFFGSVQPVANGFLEWSILLFTWLGNVESFWFVTTAVLWLVFCRIKGTLNTWSDAGRIIWALLVFFPFLMIYIVLVVAVVFVPLDYATPWLAPAKRHILGLLLFTPFLFLYFAIFLPNQKARKLLSRFWLVLKRRAPFPRPSYAEVMPILLILAWLLIIFLPLPENLLTNLVIIGGGLAILAYLMLQRSRERRR